MAKGRVILVGVGVALLAAIESAAGQPSTTPLGIPTGARNIDEGVGDMGSLPGVSRVELRRELRRDVGFGSVYRLDRPMPMGMPGQNQSMYFRIDGGLTAVFNSSVYIPTLHGLTPEVPPGTTFYIGALPTHLTQVPPPPPRAANYLDLAVPKQSQQRQQAVAARELPSTAPTIWQDDSYRAKHIGRLLDQAAAKK
jgi:hypothetical protein